MRVISLNIWCGKVYESLIDFVKCNADNADVFCFQEVFSSEDEFVEPTTGAHHHILQDLIRSLPDFVPHYFPAQDGPGMDGIVYPEMSFGLAIFTKKSLDITEFGDIFVYGERNSLDPSLSFANIPRNMAFVGLELNGKPLTIYNLHGLWNGNGKGDSESRLEQSLKAKEFIATRPGQTILCGDFNLLPDTKSMAILEDGLVNLISTHQITSTRTNLYKKEPKFADYIFVSPEIKVNQFRVLPDVASDHSPLLLDFDV